MPRISKRKNNADANKNIEKFIKYNVAIYARLSSDQDDSNNRKILKNESIEAQVDIAKKHMDNLILNGENMNLFDVYCDMGKTGSNFSRDEFTRLMQDIRLTEVNCVIVKDLSRFGRNYLEAGNYIEKIFPFLGVRFIAVSDAFDTGINGNDNKKIAMNIKNLVNDMYAKDFSKKAKIHLQQRRERGSFVGGLTPYGYTYEWVGKNKRLVVEPETKPVVELIFNTFIHEKNYSAVTRLLNARRINPPLIYKRTKAVFCLKEEEYNGWDKGSIVRILKSETYIGTLAQGKTSITERNERNRVKHDRKDWTIIEKCHEPLINKELFEKVQKIINEIKQKSYAISKKECIVPLEENIFDDVLFCGLCGKKMTRHSAVQTYKNGDIKRVDCYVCFNAYNTKIDNVCESNRISKLILSNILISAMRIEFSIYIKKPKYYLERNKDIGQKKEKEYRENIHRIDKKIENLEIEESNQYTRYRLSELKQDKYVEWKLQNGGKREILLNEKEIQEECIRNLKHVIEKQNKAVKNLMKLRTSEEMTKEFVDSLVEKIYVYPGKRVEIVYAFMNEMIYSIT